MIQRIRRNARKLAIGTLVFYFLVFVFSVWFILTRLHFNYQLESFFPSQDESIDYYKAHVKRFESEHDIVLVTCKSPTGIFDTAFLKQVNRFTDSALVAPGVDRVISPIRMARIAKAFPAPRPIPFFHPNNPEKQLEDSIAVTQGEHFVKDMLSVPAKSICIIIRTTPNLSMDSSTLLVEHLEKLSKEIKLEGYRAAGRVKAQNYIVTSLKDDFIKLAIATILALVVFLWLTFRNLLGVIFPLIVVTVGLVITLALMLGLTGGIDIVSVILPTVLLVVGVSDSVHILNHFYAEVKKGREVFDSLVATVKEIGSATFLTAITSAVGFFTLITVKVKPIANFGIFSAIGIMLIFFVSFSLLIAAIYLFPVAIHEKTGEIIPQKRLGQLFDWVSRKKWLILPIMLLAVFPMISGIRDIQVNYHFTSELKPDDPHKKDFDFFDKYFGGVRPFEMGFQVKDSTKSVFSPDVVANVAKVETFLQSKYGVKSLLSTNRLLMVANQYENGGADSAFCLPKSEEAISDAADIIQELGAEAGLNGVVSEDLRYGRITGRAADKGSAYFSEKNTAFKEFIAQNVDTNLVTFRLTGISEILDSNDHYLTGNLMEGLIYELLAIAALMGLLFRSWKVMLVSLVPNVFPLLFIGGLMGWLDIHLNLSSSILFNIAFGITVDDTIHLLAGYKLELNKGITGRQAIRNAYLHSGKAVTMTSVILCAGFLVLMLSNFNGVYNTGLLISITLFVALLSDFLFLPILLTPLREKK